MCDKVVSKNTFMLKYFLARYKTQDMCDKPIHTCFRTLKFVSQLFVTNMMIMMI